MIGKRKHCEAQAGSRTIDSLSGTAAHSPITGVELGNQLFVRDYFNSRDICGGLVVHF
jgi:hypothetical protein